MKKILKYSLYVIITFFANMIFIFAGCPTGLTTYAPCSAENGKDFIVQPKIGDSNAYDIPTEITFQYWQKARTPVFCLSKGQKGPLFGAGYPASTWNVPITCSSQYNLDNKLRAAIGYVIKNYAPSTPPSAFYDATYNSYVKVQSLIYKLLNEKNSGADAPSYDTTIYPNMLAQYNSYGKESVSISNFNLTLNDGNWTATVPITKSNVDSVSVTSLTKGRTELKDYASISGNNVSISIPQAQLSGGDQVTLTVEGSKKYYLADTRACEDNRQPIATTTTTEEIKTTSSSATGTANSYTLTVNPNGGLYNGSTEIVSTILNAGDTASINAPTRSGYVFNGWAWSSGAVFSLNQPTIGYAYNNYISSNISNGTYKQSHGTDNEYMNHVWTVPSAPSADSWNYIRLSQYPVRAGETITISGWVRINSNTLGVNLNFYHGAKTNDWENCKYGVNNTKGDWVYFSFSRKFTSTTTAHLEVFTGTLKGKSGKIDFDLRGINVVRDDGSVVPTTLIMPKSNVTLTAKWQLELEEFKIIKTNTRNQAVPNVTFNFYNDQTSCESANGIVKETCTTNQKGECVVQLIPGSYFIKEISAPNAYRLDQTCNEISVTHNGTNETTIENKTECEYYFEQDSSIYNRLSLYKDYGFRNLLNFNITNSADACSPYTPKEVSHESCLYSATFSDVLNSFNNDNLSDFNDSITSNGKISYCLTEFNAIPKIGLTNPVKAGRLVFGTTDLDEAAIRTTITKTCYIHKDDIDDYPMYGTSTQLTELTKLKNLKDNKYYYANLNSVDYEIDENTINFLTDENNVYTLLESSLNSHVRILENGKELYAPSDYNGTNCTKLFNVHNNRNYCVKRQDIRSVQSFSKYSLLFDEIDEVYYVIESSSLINENSSNAPIEDKTTNNYIKYSDYIESINLNGQSLNSFKIIPDQQTISETGEFYKISQSVYANYTLDSLPIYAEKFSGKPCVSNQYPCTLVGYGIISQFQDGKSDMGSFNFLIKEGNNSVFDFDNAGNVCEYEVEPEVIKYNNDDGKLDLEFRAIDTNKPFNRTTKSNWSNGKDNSKDNEIVRDKILNATNSYGIKEGVPNQIPKYTINLTPKIINEIRGYNSSVSYDNFYELCNENSCKSKNKFLDDLYKKGVIK